jgi:hypothetical protein
MQDANNTRQTYLVARTSVFLIFIHKKILLIAGDDPYRS